MGPYDPHPRMSRLVLLGAAALVLVSLVASPIPHWLARVARFMESDPSFIGSLAVIAAVVVWAACVVWLLASLAEEPPPWRYRSDPGHVKGAAPAPLAGRTRGWWETRLELALGVAAMGIGGWAALATQWNSGDGYGAWPLPIPMYLMPPLVFLIGTVVGLIWMIRIYRGPRDEPLVWRYRDH